MPLLTSEEAFGVSDSFLVTLYGNDLFARWKALKEEMQFIKEREYVNWLIEVANHYKNDSDDTSLVHGEAIEADYMQDNIKAEAALNEYSDQYETQQYEVSEETMHHQQQPVSFQGKEKHLSNTQNVSNNHHKLNANNYKGEGVDKTNFFTPENEAIVGLSQESARYQGEHENYSGDSKEKLNENKSSEIVLSSDEEDVDETMANYSETYGVEWGTSSQDVITQKSNDGNILREPAGQYHPAINYQPGTAHVLSEPESLATRKRFTCPHCRYSTNNTGDVRKHIVAIHERRKPNTCEHCNYRTAQKVNLVSHLISKHGYHSKYCCEKCGKYMSSPSLLRKHEAICKI